MTDDDTYTAVTRYVNSLNEATVEYINSFSPDKTSRATGLMLGQLLDYTYRLMNASFKDDKDFHNAVEDYAETLKKVGENRNGLATLTQEMIDRARAQLKERRNDR